MGGKRQAEGQLTSSLPYMETNRFCYCIGSHSILLEPTVTAEILPTQMIYPVPFAPNWCAGLTSLRGDLYPVVDMHLVMLGKPFPSQLQLLLIQYPQIQPVVLTSDDYPRQLKLSAKNQIGQADENLPGWISHTVQHEGQTLLAADHGRLLRYIQKMSEDLV